MRGNLNCSAADPIRLANSRRTSDGGDSCPYPSLWLTFVAGGILPGGGKRSTIGGS